MIRSLLALLALLPLAASATSDSWLTLLGDPMRPDVDTIQFDPVSISRADRMRTMTIRVSRSEQRVSGEGIQFRSFIGTVEFDCTRLTARFTSSQFYAAPLWQSPSRAVAYPASDVRPMAFRGIEPNPRDRLIQAACTRARSADAGGAAIVR